MYCQENICLIIIFKEMEQTEKSIDLELKDILFNLRLNINVLHKQTEKTRELIKTLAQLCSRIGQEYLREDKELAQIKNDIEKSLGKLSSCFEEVSLEDILGRLNNLFESEEKPETETEVKKKILLVEDDPLTARLIAHYLQDPRIELTSFSEAEAALDHLKDNLPDLILLDLILPGIDGFQFMRKIKSDETTKRIPLIIMSSISGEKEILQALEIGASDYITKPFSPRIVQAKIKHHLNLE